MFIFQENGPLASFCEGGVGWDVEEGGATDFPKIDVSVKPNKGDVVVFHNCIEGTTEINPQALHGGSPVIAGEKWAVNLWFRESAIY